MSPVTDRLSTMRRQSFPVQLADIIVYQNDPQLALKLLFEKYGENEEEWTRNASKMYACWKATRNHITSNNDNRSPIYLQQLYEIYASLPDTHPDKSFVRALLNTKLSDQNAVQVKRASDQFKDTDLQDRVRQLKPMISEFYEFVLPAYITNSSTLQATLSADARHVDHEKRIEKYYLCRQNVTNYFTEAGNVLATFQDKYDQLSDENTRGIYSNVMFQQKLDDLVLRVAAAVCLLTGRRSIEVLKTLEVGEDESNPLLCFVRGISKKNFQPSHTTYQIPLPNDTNFQQISRAIAFIRAYMPLENRTCQQVSKSLSYKFKRQVIRLFGRELGHTVRRTLYADRCYDQRGDSMFLCDQRSVTAWKSAALIHANRHTCSEHYQIVSYDQ
jgi:hypothetical protein